MCLAFAKGAGAQVIVDGLWRPGVSVFVGVDKTVSHLWKAAVKSGLGYYYVDNAYFDKVRGQYFRVAHNVLQHNGKGKSNGKRLAEQRIVMDPWAAGGEHVLMCPQSDTFMQFPVTYPGDWTTDARQRIAAVTDRPVVLRPWNPSKLGLRQTLPGALQGAHATVAWSSASLIESVLHGIPIIAEGVCAATPMSGTYADIESLPRPERANWAGVLADNHWTIDEFKSGRAWHDLQHQRN